MNNLEELHPSQKVITIIATGKTGIELPKETFDRIKAVSYTVGINYAPFNPHLRCFTDNVLDDFKARCMTQDELCGFGGDQNKNRTVPDDCKWFYKKRTDWSHCTLTSVLRVMATANPDKEFLLIGVDIMPDDFTNYVLSDEQKKAECWRVDAYKVYLKGLVDLMHKLCFELVPDLHTRIYNVNPHTGLKWMNKVSLEDKLKQMELDNGRN